MSLLLLSFIRDSDNDSFNPTGMKGWLVRAEHHAFPTSATAERMSQEADNGRLAHINLVQH